MTQIYAGRSWQEQYNYLFSSTSDQLQRPPRSNCSFFYGSKVASADSLITHIHIEPILKISGALPPLNLSVSMAHLGQFYFTLTSYLCTYLSRGHILSGLIKEHFHSLLTPHMHTKWHIYLIFIDKVTLTLWRDPIMKFIIDFPVSFCY
jgi:hypothetical protein